MTEIKFPEDEIMERFEKGEIDGETVIKQLKAIKDGLEKWKRGRGK